MNDYLINPIPDKAYDKLLAWLGHGFFITLILFAFLFYEERLLNFDSAYYTFHLVKFQSPLLIHDRYINYLSQCFPLFAIQQGWSLKTVLVLYSISFPLLHYLVFNIVVYLFKNAKAGIFLALALCLAFRFKHFTAVSEIISTLAMVTWLIGWMTKPVNRFSKLPLWLDWVIALCCLLLIYTGHPFVLVPVLLFLGFEIIFKKKWRIPFYWIFLAIIAVLYAFRFSNLEASSYEEKEFNRLQNAFQILSNFQDYQVWNLIKWYFQKELAFPAIIFLAAMIWKMKKNAWKEASYFLVASLGLVCVVFIHNSYISGNEKYMLDGYLGYLGVIWSLAFLLLFLQKSRTKWMIGMIAILMIFGLHRIYSKHHFFKQRLVYLQTIIDENAKPDQRKFVIRAENYSWEKMWVRGMIPLETMLLTAQESPDSVATIYIATPGRNIEAMTKEQKIIFAPVPDLHAKFLPENYFRFGKEGYVEVEKVPW